MERVKKGRERERRGVEIDGMGEGRIKNPSLPKEKVHGCDNVLFGSFTLRDKGRGVIGI